MQRFIVCWFLVLALFTSQSCKRTAKRYVREIGLNVRHYSKSYAITPRWVKKYIPTQLTMIPRFIVHEAYLSLFFIGICPINIIISLIALHQASKEVIGYLSFLQVGLAIIDIIYIEIRVSYFGKKITKK